MLEPKPAPVAPPPSSSLLARLLNIFAIPGQVFEEVRHARHSIGNWLLPTLLCAIALGVSGYVVLSTPTVWKEITTRQAKLREREASTLAELVQAGKTTQAEADKVLETFDTVTQPAVMKGAAATGGFTIGLVRVFWWGFVLWLLARGFLRSPIRYGKALEVAGLASMIDLLIRIVTLVLMVNFGKSFGAAGFSLAVSDFGGSGIQTVVAVALNLGTFWLVGVLGVGLGRLTGAPWFRAAFPVLAYWMASEFLLLLLGWGAMPG